MSDAKDAVRDRDAGHAGAVREHIISDAGDTAGNCHAGQVVAQIERTFSDAADAGGNRHAGQVEGGRERIVRDAGHRQTVDGARNVQRPTPAGRESGNDKPTITVGFGRILDIR